MEAEASLSYGHILWILLNRDGCWSIMNWLNFLFCLQSTVNIVFDRVGKVDPITRGIEIAVNYFGIQFDVSKNEKC